MTVILELEPEMETRLEKRAKDHDCDVKGYVKKLIENEINRSRTFDEILAPFRLSIEQSGLTGNELDMLFTEAHKEVYQENKEKTRE